MYVDYHPSKCLCWLPSLQVSVHTFLFKPVQKYLYVLGFRYIVLLSLYHLYMTIMVGVRFEKTTIVYFSLSTHKYCSVLHSIWLTRNITNDTLLRNIFRDEWSLKQVMWQNSNLFIEALIPFLCLIKKSSKDTMKTCSKILARPTNF